MSTTPLNIVDNSSVLPLQEYLKKRYNNRICVKLKSETINNSPYIVAFHRYIKHYQQLEIATDVIYAVAQQYPTLRFCVGDWDEHKSPNNSINVLGIFNVSRNPIIYAVNNNTKRKYKQAIHVEKLTKFCKDFLENILIKPIWLDRCFNEHLKIITEFEFDDFVTDNPKDLYIVFYKPQIDYLLLPLLYKLAAILHNTGDAKHIDIVCMETSFNVCNLRTDKYAAIQSFFLKCDRKTELVKHTEELPSVENMLSFISKNSKNELKNYTRYGVMKCKRNRHPRKDRYNDYNYLERFNPENTYLTKKYGITKDSQLAKEEQQPCERYHRHLEVKHKKPQKKRREDYERLENTSHSYDEKYGIDFDSLSLQ